MDRQGLTRRLFVASAGAGALVPALAAPAVALGPRDFLEPHMHLQGTGDESPRVALTFDACGGETDHRILDLLLAERIPATIFVAGPWLQRNRPIFDRLVTRPDLFEIGNHGLHHHAAIDEAVKLWGVPAAGSPHGVALEVEGGAALIVAAGGLRPRWFRGATALYTSASIQEIEGLGYRVAGFSINGDDGASLPAARVAANYRRAQDGAVLISHINHPEKHAGAGVAEGIRALKARGMGFVRLSETGVKVTVAA
ncbi:polysaccharide deacetylase family protein [Acidimangrovimonas sediminis]|uniref:polysaccharide deacetylase family protein n=1 Tax=Acidimangrovimonas sediminis TaxID=2056283 RepID=UPI000C80F6BF|nr:polysaccharide deacetylase family protein [Acidimangrovimonas sediminis]